MPLFDYGPCHGCGQVFERLNGKSMERCQSCGAMVSRRPVQRMGYRRDQTTTE